MIGLREAANLYATTLGEAPSLTLETAPGGHLGVLTGRRARDTTGKLLDSLLGA